MTAPVSARVAALDWDAVGTALDGVGCALLGPVLTDAECAALATLYDQDAPFRSRVVMERHGFGRGEYKYFAYDLPPPVAALREALYPPLARIANGWAVMAGMAVRYPNTHAAFLARCHAGGQLRPTPLLLRYGPGDYNCLHQDLYGDLAFPLQVVILLDQPGPIAEGGCFEGGELVLTEQRPRMQSRAEVLSLRRGEAAVFAVNRRPVHGARGVYHVTMRHGVSRIRRGQRHTLGVIFHDAL